MRSNTFVKPSSPLYIVLFTVFLDLLGFGILIPLLPYVALEYNASESQVGYLMASYSIAQFLFAPLWGRLSDRFGRRPILLISIAGAATGYLIFALSTTLTGLFISRIMAGVAAANISTASAVVADIMPPEKRTSGMGMIGAAIGMGFVFGPGLAGLLVGEDNFTLPFLAAAGLSSINFIIALFFLPETLNKAEPASRARRVSRNTLSSALSHPIIVCLLSISLLYYISFSCMESTFALFVLEQYGIGPRHNAYLLLLVGVIMVIVQGGIVGRLARLIGDQTVLVLGIIGLLGGLQLIGISSDFPVFMAGLVMLSVSAGFAGPSMTSLLSQRSAQSIQGGVLGLNQSMASLGRILGPLMGPYLFEFSGPRVPFYAAAALVGVALLILLPAVFYSTQTARPQPETSE